MNMVDWKCMHMAFVFGQLGGMWYSISSHVTMVIPAAAAHAHARPRRRRQEQDRRGGLYRRSSGQALPVPTTQHAKSLAVFHSVYIPPESVVRQRFARLQLETQSPSDDGVAEFCRIQR